MLAGLLFVEDEEDVEDGPEVEPEAELTKKLTKKEKKEMMKKMRAAKTGWTKGPDGEWVAPGREGGGSVRRGGERGVGRGGEKTQAEVDAEARAALSHQ